MEIREALTLLKNKMDQEKQEQKNTEENANKLLIKGFLMGSFDEKEQLEEIIDKYRR